MNIVCLGDSITHAYSHAECDKWTVILQNKLAEWKPGKYKVYDRGMGGDTTVNGYQRFENEVLPLLPAVVLIEFGFNDSSVWGWSGISRVGLDEYKAKLTDFYKSIKRRRGGRFSSSTTLSPAGMQYRGMGNLTRRISNLTIRRFVRWRRRPSALPSTCRQ